MQINVTFDQNVATLPAGFVAAVDYVVNYFDSTFTNPVTVNIDVGYGEIAGQSLGTGALGESETYIDSVSYAQALAALKANRPSPTQQTAYATLPASSPLAGTLWMATAEEKALGLLAGNDPSLDGYVGFSSVYPFSYAINSSPPANQYYFVGVVEHEITEVLGRDSWLGDGLGNTTSYGVMDLFRYSAPSVRDLTVTPPSPYNVAYFSINNGSTNFDNWNTNPNGDLGDWATSAGADALLAFSPSGQINQFGTTDLTLMNVLGWDVNVSRVVIQTDGLTSLTLVGGQNYYLFDSSGSGPSLKYGGTDFVTGESGSWTPIGAVQTASGYEVAWKNGSADQYTVWTTDSNGNYLTNSAVVSGSDYALESLEPIFNQDLNGDKTIGLTKTLIQTDGSTSLTAVANHFFLYGSSGSGPSLKYGGTDFVTGESGSWTPIGAVQTAIGYEVAWKNGSADQYTVWTTDSNGNYLTNIAVVSGSDYALESLEPIFNQDLNGDKTIGLTKTLIQTDGSTSLTAVANHFFLYGSSGSGPSLKYGGTDFVAGESGSWTPIGAVQTASGYEVAWKNGSADQYTVWTTDSNGNYLTNIAVVSGSDYTLEVFEPTFGQDLNGDGIVGVLNSAGSAETLTLGGAATLGYSASAPKSGATLTSNDNTTNTAGLAVFNQYMAANFGAASAGQGSIVVRNPPPSPELPLTQPHT
jgi:20S proteasome alpha/beta subunit